MFVNELHQIFVHDSCGRYSVFPCRAALRCVITIEHRWRLYTLPCRPLLTPVAIAIGSRGVNEMREATMHNGENQREMQNVKMSSSLD